MAIPVWVTDANFGVVYEENNLLKQLETEEPTDTFSVISSHAWLSISSLDVLQGVTPAVEITTNISITIRATSTTADDVDKVFLLVVEPTDSTKQISWTPGSVGSGPRGHISELSVDINNFEAVEGSIGIYGRSEKTFDFRGLPTGWSHTRADTGTYIDGFGVLQIAAADVVRPYFEYDAGLSIYVRRGNLAEPTRTNLLTRSEEFDHADWSPIRATVVTNAAMSPDGTFTADKWVSSVDNATHRVDYPVTLTDGNIHSYSIHAKAGEYDGVAMQIGSGSVSGNYVSFNLTTGIKTENGTATGEIIPLNNGWYRCVVTMAAGTTDRVVAGIWDGATQSYIGDTVKGIYVWGAQLEEGSIATSYIPTTTVAVLRAADVFTLPMFNLDYDINVSDTVGTTTTTETITNDLYTLIPRTTSAHVTEVVIDDYHQETILNGTNLKVFNDGTISGTIPTTGIHNFELFVIYKSEIFLGPATFSLTSEATTSGTWDIIAPLLFGSEIKEHWFNTNAIIIGTNAYRPFDKNFGLTHDIGVFMAYGVDKNYLEYHIAGVNDKLGFKIVVGDLKYISTDDYDVIYYEIIDTNSDSENYIFNNQTVKTSSFDLVRSRLVTSGFTADGEILPEYMPNWFAMLPVGKVVAGTGPDAIAKFNQDDSLQTMVGRTIEVDRVMVVDRFTDELQNTLIPTNTVRMDAPPTVAFTGYDVKINVTLKPETGGLTLTAHDTIGPIEFANVASLTLTAPEVTVLPLVATAPASTLRLWTLDPVNASNEEPELDGSNIPTWWLDSEAAAWQEINTSTAQLPDLGIRLDSIGDSGIPIQNNPANFPQTYHMAIAYKPIARTGISMNIVSGLFDGDGIHESGSSSTVLRTSGSHDHIVVDGQLYQTGVHTRGNLYNAIQSNNVIVVRDNSLGTDIDIGFASTGVDDSWEADIYGIITYSNLADEADAIAFMQAQIP